jgi:acyl-CoA hydrolase
MEGKQVDDTSVVGVYQMLPGDANPAGNVHGGVIMKHVDSMAGVVAIRHARCNAVTASIDRMDFHSPVFVGDLLILKSSLNFVGRTSMEVGVRVEAENLFTGDVRHTASAYITFVALDKDGRPAEVPPLILLADEQIRRNREAVQRRQVRLNEKAHERRSQR